MRRDSPDEAGGCCARTELMAATPKKQKNKETKKEMKG
jgi:hypothetical protein